MGKAVAVQLGVGGLDVVVDPGAVLAVTPDLAAGGDHAGEIAVNAQRKAGQGRGFADGLFERTVQAELRRLEHHARVGRPPQNRRVAAVPRENPLAIGLLQMGAVEHAARCQQAWVRRVRAPGGIDRGEGIFWLQPGQRRQMARQIIFFRLTNFHPALCGRYEDDRANWFLAYTGGAALAAS